MDLDFNPPPPLRLSTGHGALDLVLGGGWPIGRLCEVVGPAGAGKRTLGLAAVASAQREGKTVAWVDGSHDLDPAVAIRLGVDLGRMLVSQPDTLEQGLDIVESLARSGAVDLLVVKDLASLEAPGDHPSIGTVPRLFSKSLRRLTTRPATVLFLSTLHARPSYSWHDGVREDTRCGNALKYFSSVRLDVRRWRTDDTDTRVRVIKNKFAPPFQTVNLCLNPLPSE